MRKAFPSHIIPDSKIHGAHMRPTWGRQDSAGPHMGQVNLDLWDVLYSIQIAVMADYESFINHTTRSNLNRVNVVMRPMKLSVGPSDLPIVRYA